MSQINISKFHTNSKLLLDNDNINLEEEPSQETNETSSSSDTSSTEERDVPALVKSRGVADYESSTIPDSWHTPTVFSIEKNTEPGNDTGGIRPSTSQHVEPKSTHTAQGAQFIHQLVLGDYVEVKDKTVTKDGKAIPDWATEDIEQLEALFEKRESQAEAQKGFDKVYNDITRAYVSEKEKKKNNDDRTSHLRSLEQIDAVPQNVRENSVKQVNDHFNRLDHDNSVFYDLNKGELNSAARSSKFELELKGLNDISYESSSDSPLHHSETEDNAVEVPQFRQDSSDVVQDDFPTWEPGED